MHCSAEETLLAIEACVPSPLIAHSHMERLDTATRTLHVPGNAALGFACRLAEPDPAADALIWVPLSCRQAEATAGQPPFDDAALAAPFLWRIRALYRACGAPAAPAGPWAVCLRFRCGGGTPILVTAPNVFFTLDAHRRKQRMPDHAWLATTAFPLLTGVEYAPHLAATLATCLAALPSGAHVRQIGLLLRHVPPLLRLQVWSVAARVLVDYLEALGWPGHRSDLASTLARLAPFVPPFVVAHLDMGKTVEPRIALDFRYPGHGLPGTENGRQTLLDHLVQARLCFPRKRDALQAWSGSTVGTNEQPCRILNAADPPGAGSPVRSIHRLQINYRPGRPLEAIAYLSCRRPRQTGQGMHDPIRCSTWC